MVKIDLSKNGSETCMNIENSSEESNMAKPKSTLNNKIDSDKSDANENLSNQTAFFDHKSDLPPKVRN